MPATTGLFTGAAGLYGGDVGLIKPSMILSSGAGLARQSSSGGGSPPPTPPSGVGELVFSTEDNSAWSWFF